MPANLIQIRESGRVMYFFSSESIANQIVNRKKAVIEFRDSSWWNGSALKEIEKEDIAFCSIDVSGLTK